MHHTPSEIVVLTREGVRAVDRAAVDELGIPGIVLMENAAIAIAQVCLELIAQHRIHRIGIVCGPGNNGGDGLALARHLANKGHDPLIILTTTPERYTGDAATNLKIAEAMELRILDPLVALVPQIALEILYSDGRDHGPDQDPKDVLIVDAIFGTGLNRPVQQPGDLAVKWINGLGARGATIVAVDIPTGLDCDTGLPLGEHVVRAGHTVTLAGLKKGLLEPQAQPYCGRIHIGDIGVPIKLLRRFGQHPSSSSIA